MKLPTFTVTTTFKPAIAKRYRNDLDFDVQIRSVAFHKQHSFNEWKETCEAEAYVSRASRQHMFFAQIAEATRYQRSFYHGGDLNRPTAALRIAKSAATRPDTNASAALRKAGVSLKSYGLLATKAILAILNDVKIIMSLEKDHSQHVVQQLSSLHLYTASAFPLLHQ